MSCTLQQSLMQISLQFKPLILDGLTVKVYLQQDHASDLFSLSSSAGFYNIDQYLCPAIHGAWVLCLLLYSSYLNALYLAAFCSNNYFILILLDTGKCKRDTNIKLAKSSHKSGI